MLLAHLCTTAHAVDAGIGLDAREFKQFHARFLDLGHHGIIEARALDGSTTVGEQDAFAKLCKFLVEVLQLILSEIYLYRYVINKVVHLNLVI